MMRNMKTPQAILLGLSLIAIAIASVPFTSTVIKEAHAAVPKKVQICNDKGDCARVLPSGLLMTRVY